MTGNILVTGGAGYIGSHACIALLEAGYDVVVVDNLVNATATAIERVREVAGRDVHFHEIDLVDEAGIERVFASSRFDAVIHFAGLKAVGESASVPLRYYRNNVTGTLVLLEAMKRHGVHDLVFSSSATVYGEVTSVPITESFPLSATNAYGWTKLMIEQICRDVAAAEADWRISLLRYFNPAGAHPSGRLGEDPRGVPSNLMPYIMQVAVGRQPALQVFGGDYPTPDGTGVRDYIHVMDLVDGHLAALRHFEPGCTAINLGTGKGYSVLEMIEAASRIVGKPIPYEIVARRPGDIGECYADPTRALEKLEWRATRGLDEMVADHWRWQSTNPSGYEADPAVP